MIVENKEIGDLQENGYFVGIVNGAKCKDLRSTIAQIASAFQFPDYYGKNLDAFDECINDLEWLTESNYAIVIENSNLLMAKDTQDNKLYLINMLDEVSNEWSGVSNYKNDDIFRRKADFKVIYN